MASYRELFTPSDITIDRRDGIGPHHLAIGKTRKLFEHDGVVHAFYSRGYEIAHTRVDAATNAVLGTEVLALPVAWGGGAFCVDNAGARVGLVFAHRNQHELCYAAGKIAGGEIQWQGWRSLLMSGERQAAPWLELGPDGTAWASVVARDGDYRLAVIKPDGAVKTGGLFEAGETPWYHSCVQVEPFAKDRAVAIGFRGEFPRRTELVYRTVTRDLALGPATTLAPCNVNDKLTFHFQAVGDPVRGRAHIVYLDDGLTTSHAVYENGAWRVAKAILPVASFAPQIAIDPEGNVVLIAAGYDGAVWHAVWSRPKGWSKPRVIAGAEVPNISVSFSHTGYGTGGLISAARSSNGRVPYLFGNIEDDAAARARLALAVAGGDGFASDALKVRVSGRKVTAELRLLSLRKSDTTHAGRAWVAAVPAGKGQALKIVFASSRTGIVGAALWQERDKAAVRLRMRVAVTADLFDVFTRGEAGVLRASVTLDKPVKGLDPAAAWAEYYAEGWSGDGAHRAGIVDIAPFDPETASKMTADPLGIPRAYKRMV